MQKLSTIEFARQLIQIPSVTPDDNGCQNLISTHLEKLGFANSLLKFEDVDNLWSIIGKKGPIFCFAGHTDVVPSGEIEAWQYPPFEATIASGMLHGRGAADMKGSIAAMMTATERFLANTPNPKYRIAWLITSDEEGKAINGTRRVMEYLSENQTQINWCLVGEPSSTNTVGDVIKNGRRGSMGAHLIVKGIQGHVAYPHLADNPVHRGLEPLHTLIHTTWDEGNEFFPATSFQISNISAGTGALNVIPGGLHIDFNFRFSTEQTTEELQRKTETILNNAGLDYAIDWWISGHPFLTPGGKLIDVSIASIAEHTGQNAELSTDGGTSDGRFIAPTGAELIELGPVNASIHKVNESVSVDELETLSTIYESIMHKLNQSI